MEEVILSIVRSFADSSFRLSCRLRLSCSSSIEVESTRRLDYFPKDIGQTNIHGELYERSGAAGF
jgi:hypothetical protein